MFSIFCLKLSRYYEDVKIDHKTGEANLTQMYLQVLCILIKRSLKPTGTFYLLAYTYVAWVAIFKVDSLVISRKPLISLAHSMPANSRSFCIGQSMLLTRLCMPPGSSWALANEGCKSLFELKYHFLLLSFFWH